MDCPSTSVQSLRRFNQSFNSCPLEKKLNIVARTESRRDTDSSTVKDTAFVVCRTVFITHTPLMWWDNIKETRAVAWFWQNHWEKEAVKQKRRKISGGNWGDINEGQTTWLWNVTDKHALLFSDVNSKLADYTLNTYYHLSQNKPTC